MKAGGLAFGGEVRTRVLLVGESGQLRTDGQMKGRDVHFGFHRSEFGEQLIDVHFQLANALTIAGHVRTE